MGAVLKTIFFDVDTQLDFLYPAGALAVPGAEDIVENLAALTRYAAAHDIQIVSTADAHAENDPEFRTWPPHCVVETVGQHKSSATLLSRHLVLTTGPDGLKAIESAVRDAPQIIVEKQMLDCFTNPHLRPLLKVLSADRYVVYGVVTELCVQCALLGLLQTGADVSLVADGIKSLSATDAHRAVEQFQARGGVVTNTAAITL